MIIRNFTFIFVFLLVAMEIASAQQVKSKISIVKITSPTNVSVTGILYEVGDSSVSIYTDRTNIDRDALERDSLPLKIFTYREIQQIKVRNRSAVVKGALIGGGSGLLLGLLIDEVNVTVKQEPFFGTDPNATFSPTFTIIFTLLGTGTGAIIGASSKKFEIDGRAENFRASGYALMKYSFKKNL